MGTICPSNVQFVLTVNFTNYFWQRVAGGYRCNPLGDQGTKWIPVVHSPSKLRTYESSDLTNGFLLGHTALKLACSQERQVGNYYDRLTTSKPTVNQQADQQVDQQVEVAPKSFVQ